MISVQNTTLDFSELSLALQTDVLSVTNSQLLIYWSQALAIGRMKSSGHSYCTWPSSILVILVVRASDIKALHFVNGGLYLQMWRSVFPDVQNLLDSGSELWFITGWKSSSDCTECCRDCSTCTYLCFPLNEHDTAYVPTVVVSCPVSYLGGSQFESRVLLAIFTEVFHSVPSVCPGKFM
jgi:hypothetical protein